MKNCKHYLLFLLAGALLVLPVTQHYAMSWDDIRGRISSFFSGDTLQKVVPGAIITFGVLGGLYYWWTRKGGGPSKEGLVTPVLQQFQVYSQFNKPYGRGEASCGYHALLRGMQIVQAKNEYESDENLQGTLNSPNLIAQYFGDDGIWRQAIIQRRQNDEYHGDWLNDEELEYLWKNYRNDFIPQDVNCEFFTIPLFILVGTEFSQLEPYIRDNVRPFLNRGKLFRIFALGTMLHWYPLVMYQNQEGKREYYIADSDNNKYRARDTNAQRIINLIEQ